MHAETVWQLNKQKPKKRWEFPCQRLPATDAPSLLGAELTTQNLLSVVVPADAGEPAGPEESVCARPAGPGECVIRLVTRVCAKLHYQCLTWRDPGPRTQVSGPVREKGSLAPGQTIPCRGPRLWDAPRILKKPGPALGEWTPGGNSEADEILCAEGGEGAEGPASGFGLPRLPEHRAGPPICIFAANRSWGQFRGWAAPLVLRRRARASSLRPTALLGLIPCGSPFLLIPPSCPPLAFPALSSFSIFWHFRCCRCLHRYVLSSRPSRVLHQD